MTRRRLAVLITLTLLVGGGVCLHYYLRKSPIERQFDLITEGMTPGDVQVLLGERFGPVLTTDLGPSFSGDCWETADGTIFVIYEHGRVVEKGWVNSNRASSPLQKLLEQVMSLF